MTEAKEALKSIYRLTRDECRKTLALLGAKKFNLIGSKKEMYVFEDGSCLAWWAATNQFYLCEVE